MCRFVSLFWRRLLRLFDLSRTTASHAQKDAQTVMEGKEKTVGFRDELLGANKLKIMYRYVSGMEF